MPGVSRPLARFLVFSTSAAVLVIEILAGRLLAPYLGVSLEVFTGIIGVILAGISLGAWLGGRAADRMKPERLPGPLLILGGLAALASPPIVDFFGPSFRANPISIVFLTAVGFLLPAVLLSAVSPIVVKIRLNSLERTGSVVGSYSAIGTAGAIVGTFVTGFFLIAAFPTRPIVAGVGFLLVAGGVALTWRQGKWVAGVALLVGLIAAPLLAAAQGPCQFETTYHCAIVEVDQTRPSGRILVLDRGFNSYVDLQDPTYLDFRYARVVADVIDASFPAGPLDVVSVGGGGFTFPLYLDATRPGTDHIVLEIDAQLLDIARDELGFEDQAEVVIADARQSINDVAADSVDLVIGDAFSGLSVPWHLTTSEFVETVRSRLQDEGVYVINVIDYADVDFARATAATFEEVFAEVLVLAPPGYFTGDGGGNYVIAGSDIALDIEAIQGAIAARGGTEIAVTGDALTEFIDGVPPLRDDFAPVDQMIDHL